MSRKLRRKVDVLAPVVFFSLSSNLLPRHLPLLSPLPLNWSACFHGCERALVLVVYSAAPTQRNAGSCLDGRFKRWTQSTHTLWGGANKLRSGLGVVGENDVGIITFRDEVWDECIHALYHPRRGTQRTRRRRVGRAFCVQLRRLFTHISYVLAWIPLREARWRTNYAWTCAPVGWSSAATHDRRGFYSHIFI